MVAAWDARRSERTRATSDELESEGIHVELASDPTPLVERARCVIKSPGIPFTAKPLSTAADRGLPVVDELEIGWRLCQAPLIAVTGTNGKSSTAALVESCLRGSGFEVSLAGNTIFGPPLSGVACGRADVVVCEVSSFQLEGCPCFLPEVAVFTNLTPDHLDRHGSMESYGAAKSKAFFRGERATPLAVINLDDPFGTALARGVRARGGRVVGYGESQEAEYRLESVTWTIETGSLSMRTPHGAMRLRTKLPGPHNALNVAAAIAFAGATGQDLQVAARSIEHVAVPGRLERIKATPGFDVCVDFAHNRGGVRAVLATARKLLADRPGTLRVVLSATRLFDPGERIAMGREARRLADHLILTTDTRRPDEPPGVPDELVAGAQQETGAALEIVEQREQAIATALRAGRPGDVVLVLGRGNVTAPLYDPSGHRVVFDDRESVRDALSQIPPAAA